VGKDKEGGPTSQAGAEAETKNECGGQSEALGNSQGALEKSPGSGEEDAVASHGR